MPRQLVLHLERKDYRCDTFRSGGPGGQHQNKTSSGVRFTHLESGAVGESREERSQHENRKRAFQRLHETPKFRMWLTRTLYERCQQQTIEQWVDVQLTDDHIVAEVQHDGRWVPWCDEGPEMVTDGQTARGGSVDPPAAALAE